jgi:YfiH family protein
VIELRAFPGLSAVPGLAHGVSTRAGGVSLGAFASLNVGRSTGDAPEAVAENRRRLGEALGSLLPPLFPRQVHGDTVAFADEGQDGLGEADAVVTGGRGRPVGVLGADCPGVLLVDPSRRALAVVHSGWRGTLAGVVLRALDALSRRFGSTPASLRAGIGPGISARRYEVGPEVARAFEAAGPDGAVCVEPSREGRFRLDLARAIRLQLTRAGVPEAAVETMGGCTYDDRHAFFSHRRDGPSTGRHALVAMWTDGAPSPSPLNSARAAAVQ